MADMYLSREDLDLVDLGLRNLMAEQRKDVGLQKRVAERVDRDGLSLHLRPDSVDRVAVDLDQVASAKEWVEAAVAVAGAAWAVYKAYKSGIELSDRFVRKFEFDSKYSLEELIDARNQVEQQLFAKGL